jgi:hypothetical protein
MADRKTCHFVSQGKIFVDAIAEEGINERRYVYSLISKDIGIKNETITDSVIEIRLLL